MIVIVNRLDLEFSAEISVVSSGILGLLGVNPEIWLNSIFSDKFALRLSIKFTITP